MTADILTAPCSKAALIAAPPREPHHWPLYWASEVAPYLGARVAEIGAGTTPVAVHLNRDTKCWTCVEPDQRLARRLSPRAARGEFGPRCTVMNGWVVDLPQSEPFDTILYANTLEHIPADRAELAAAAKRLRRGGHLIVLSEAHPFLYSSHDADTGRVRRYTRRGLLRIEPPGFQPIALRYLDAAGYAAAIAESCLPTDTTPTPKRLAFWDEKLVPLSRRIDRLTGHRFGKSLLAVWRRIV
jgi:SAM-dependent methyltransferase